jgi:hypothetical protein
LDHQGLIQRISKKIAPCPTFSVWMMRKHPKAHHSISKFKFKFKMSRAGVFSQVVDSARKLPEVIQSGGWRASILKKFLSGAQASQKIPK